MFSNNTKISSFYPTIPNNFFTKTNTTNTTNTTNNDLSSIRNMPLNFQDKTISDSVELALITINLSLAKFKSMNKDEVENYVKNIIYNNSFESKKYMLALNILINETDRTFNNIIKQQLPNKNNNQSNLFNFNFQENKINLNDAICIEPDEFNLNTDNTTKIDYNTTKLDNNTFFNDNTNNSNQTFFIKSNKNLEMSTFNGNPMGTFKITNSLPANSLRPINQTKKLFNQTDNTTNYSNTTKPIYLSDPNLPKKSSHQLTTNIKSNNNVILQTSHLANQNSFSNNGKKRSSNMDISKSNDYIVIN